MKTNILFFSLLALSLSFIACEDTLNSVGLDTKPDSDAIRTLSDTIFLGEKYATTIQADSVYKNFNITGFADNERLKTKAGAFLLGSFYDSEYGRLKADFTTAFYHGDNNLFNKEMTSIDSVVLRLNYHTWVGDSLARMVAKVYPAKALPTIFEYSNIDLKKYAESTLWATKTYTAYDRSVPDSVRQASGYYPNVSFDLSQCKMPGSALTIAEAFYKEWKTNPATFGGIKEFENFFKGVYVTTEGGDGSLLRCFEARLEFKYRYKLSSGKDTTAIAYIESRNDIKSACQYINDTKDIPLNQQNLDATYIKAPAGLSTQYTIPIKKIKEILGDRVLNTVKFKVSAYPPEDRMYALNVPASLMLIKSDSLNVFFKKSKAVQAPYSFKATISNYTYNFGDISALIRDAIKTDPDKDIKVVLLPIKEESLVLSTNYIITRTAQDIHPSAVRLRTGKEDLRLEIISSEIAK